MSCAKQYTLTNKVFKNKDRNKILASRNLILDPLQVRNGSNVYEIYFKAV